MVLVDALVQALVCLVISAMFSESALAQALSAEEADLSLRLVQPAAVSRRAVDCEAAP